MSADLATLKSWPTMLALVFAALIYPATLIPPPAENFPLGGYLAMFLIMMFLTAPSIASVIEATTLAKVVSLVITTGGMVVCINRITTIWPKL